MTKTTTSRYTIKCDECHENIGETNSLRESAEGGKCADCRATLRIELTKIEARIATARYA